MDDIELYANGGIIVYVPNMFDVVETMWLQQKNIMCIESENMKIIMVCDDDRHIEH